MAMSEGKTDSNLEQNSGPKATVTEINPFLVFNR
jgi:hypothetical protein